MALLGLRKFLIGDPLETADIQHEKLNKRRGLAVLASDALSSTAYATDEILLVIGAAGVAGVGLTMPISYAIAALILIVGISYLRTIHAYPTGGGGYTVAKQNLGTMPGLIAGASLLVDYCLTVAVSICAGVAALTSAEPAFQAYEVPIALGVLFFILIVNLRGLRESSLFFSIPTYGFIIVFGGTLVWGIFQALTGALPHSAPAIAATSESIFRPLSLFLILQGFASGCSALTGIEAVSNGVQAFKPPQSRNASIVLMLMVGLLATFFLGTSFLAHWIGAVHADETATSQIARTLYGGKSILYYTFQLFTGLILLLAANTAYTDFPRLSSLLAQDRYLPRQLTSLGDRLVFSNGILALSTFVALLIIAFGAKVDALIPLYMIGVFVTFTLSQAGMVRYWIQHKKQERHWLMYVFINGTGAICTAVVGAVVLIVKWTEGAYITFIAILSLIFVMRLIHRHYEEFRVQISLDNAKPPKPYVGHKVVIPVSDVHRGVLEAVRYARSISSDVSALYVDLGNEEKVSEMKRNWSRWVPDVPLVILPSPYRSVIRPILNYLDDLRENESTETAVTVVIPEFVPVKWWHQLLHNQTALSLRFALLFHRRSTKRYKVLADVPYYLRR